MNKWIITSLIFVALLHFNTSCDSSSSDSSSAAPTVDVTGTWSGNCTILSSVVSDTISLTQDGSNVTGTDSGGTQYTGNVSGNTLTLATSVANNSGGNTTLEMSGPVEGDSVNLSGTINATTADGTTISGPANCTWTR